MRLIRAGITVRLSTNDWRYLDPTYHDLSSIKKNKICIELKTENSSQNLAMCYFKQTDSFEF